MGVPSDPESVRGLLTDDEVDRLAHETVAGPVVGDVSVGDLVDARLGAAVTDRLVEPLLAGVYAGHARELSAEQAVPALAAAAHEGRPLLDVARAAADASTNGSLAGRPVFASLVGGLGTLPEILQRELARRRRSRCAPAPSPAACAATVRAGSCRPGPRPRWSTSGSTPSCVAVPAAPTRGCCVDVAPAAADGARGRRVRVHGDRDVRARGPGARRARRQRLPRPARPSR